MEPDLSGLVLVPGAAVGKPGRAVHPLRPTDQLSQFVESSEPTTSGSSKLWASVNPGARALWGSGLLLLKGMSCFRRAWGSLGKDALGFGPAESCYGLCPALGKRGPACVTLQCHSH